MPHKSGYGKKSKSSPSKPKLNPGMKPLKPLKELGEQVGTAVSKVRAGYRKIKNFTDR